MSAGMLVCEEDVDVDGRGRGRGRGRLGPVDWGAPMWPFGSVDGCSLSSSSEKRSGSAMEDSMSTVFVREEKKRMISPRWKQSHACEFP